MSKADQAKWDARYRAGAFAERTHPSALLASALLASSLLEAWVKRLPTGGESSRGSRGSRGSGGSRGRALDLACGAGRNSLFLARHGFEVTGLDVSSEGLKRAAANAEREGLAVTWMRHDLDDGLALSGPFDLVCLFRYFNADVIQQLPRLLAPGGILMVEAHLATDQPVAGPSNPAFRAQPGELQRLLPGLDVLHQEEGIIDDPDGRPVAIARLVGSLANPRGTDHLE